MKSEAIKLEQEYLELQMQFIVKSQSTWEGEVTPWIFYK